VDPADRGSPLASWWLNNAQQQPQGCSLLFEGSEISHSDLLSEAEGLVAALVSGGVVPRTVIGVSIDNVRSMPALLCAGAMAGVGILPLNPAMPGLQKKRLLLQAGCRHLLAAEPDPSAGATHIPWPDPAGSTDNLPGYGNQELCGGEDDSIVLVVPTSGSSGEPKGVMLSRNNLQAAVAASGRVLPLGRQDLWLNCLPLFHVGGLSILYRCARAGAAVLLHRAFSAQRLWSDLNNYPVTHLSLVPPMLQRLLDVADGRSAPQALKRVLIGGGQLSPDLALRAHAGGWPICVSYGLSEAGSQVATDCSDQAGVQPGVVGRPLPGMEVRFSAGSEGRISLRGTAVMHGYANPALEPGEGLRGGWYETGDMGRMDARGVLRILGRVDDVVVTGGKNVHPLEVELCLEACRGVDRAAVAGVPDPVWGARLAVLYTGNVTPAQLEAWCRKQLPGYLRPRLFLQVESLPLNPLGKVERKALQEQLGELMDR
jgi:O-succinylbenzoic acid--CoA ligase